MTLASAQQPAPAERSQRAQLTADDIAAFTDARIAAIKAALKLTPAQEKNWPAVEQTLRDISKERIARREARGAAGQRTDPTERLRGRADALTIRAGNMRRLADAEKPLYQSLDEAQKRRFGMAFRFAAARRHMAEARTHGAGRPNKLAERSLATSPRDSHGAGWSAPRRLRPARAASFPVMLASLGASRSRPCPAALRPTLKHKLTSDSDERR
jgi:hypothetical protein